MGVLDFISNIFGGATDAVQAPVDELMQGIGGNELIQTAQEQIEQVTSSADNIVTGVTEGVQNAVDGVLPNDI